MRRTVAASDRSSPQTGAHVTSGDTTFPDTKLEDQLREELQDLSGGISGKTLIVRAPAGAGKSRILRRLLVENMQEKKLERVLWVVREVNQPKGKPASPKSESNARQPVSAQGLAQEALNDFRLLTGGKMTVRKLTRTSKAARFNWDVGGPEIKIISHARLPLIFSDYPRKRDAELAKAELVVIDEDPVHALILDGSVCLADKSNDFGFFYNALRKVARRPGKRFGLNHRDQVEELFGVEFFALLQEQLQGNRDDQNLLAQITHMFQEVPDPLQQADPRSSGFRRRKVLLDALAAAFLEDITQHRVDQEVGSRRFSILRKIEKGKGSETKRGLPLLRFSLLSPMKLDQHNFIILDAYADTRIYEKVFPSCRTLKFTRDRKLRIEVSDALRLDPPRIASQVTNARSRTLQVLEEVHDLAQSRNRGSETLLVLTKQAKGHLDSMFATCETDKFPFRTELYWYKGRGVNAFRGANVFAPSLPYLNRAYRDHTLSALFRHDVALMDEMKKHAQAAELLQILHRSRQASTSDGATPPFTLVGAFHEEMVSDPALSPAHRSEISVKTLEAFLEPLHSEVEVVPYHPTQIIAVGERNGRWMTALNLMCQELLVLFPDGVPHAALQALPLVSPRRGKLTRDAKSFGGFLARLIGHPGLPPEWKRTNLMRQRCLAGESVPGDNEWRYVDLEQEGSASNQNLVAKAVEAAPASLIKHQVKSDPRKSKGRGRSPVVYVSASLCELCRERAAQRSLTKLEKLVALAKSSDPSNFDDFVRKLPPVNVASPNRVNGLVPRQETVASPDPACTPASS